MRGARVPAAVALAALSLYLAQALATPSPWLLPDERAFADGARSLLGDGRDGPRTLWSLLVAPLWLLDTGAAAAATRALHALALALAAVPTYLLARRLGGPRAAAAAAALLVVAAPAVYASSLLPAAPAALAVALGAWVLAAGRPLAAAALLVAAAAVWPALLPLALVGLAAAAVLRVGAAPFLRWPGAAVFAVAAAAAYPAFLLARRSQAFAAAADDPAATLHAAAGSLGALALGLGVVPLVLALALAGRFPLLPAALVALALSAGVRAVGRDRGVDDAALLAAVPLVAAAAAAALAPGRLRTRGVAAAAAVVLALAAAAARDGARAPRAAGLALADALGTSPLVAALLALAVAAAAAAAVGIVRGSRAAALRAAAPAALAAALPLALAAQLLAWGDASSRARELREALGSPPDAAAEAAGGAEVVLPGPGPLDADELDTLLFWTPTARVAAPPVAARAVAAETGAFEPPLRTDGLVLELGAEVAGEPVAVLPLGRLVRPAGGEARAAQTVEGIEPDGWSGARVVLRRFAAAPSARLLVRVSREAWGGPHVGGTVRVHLEPPGAEPRLVAEFEVPERAAHEVEVEVPPAPFAVVLELPTFSPAQFGEADQRQLGAQVTFAYA